MLDVKIAGLDIEALQGIQCSWLEFQVQLGLDILFMYLTHDLRRHRLAHNHTC